MTLEEFVEEIYFDLHENPDVKYAFFLGAGCSKSSGIPLASELAEDWYKRLKEKKKSACVAFDKKYPKAEVEQCKNNYFEVFEALFTDSQLQQKEIQKLTTDTLPATGYYALAELMQKKEFNIVITTNFDDLIQDALIYSGNKRALVITHQDLASFIDRNETPLICKIHGDAHLKPFNNSQDTKELPSNLNGKLQALLTNTKLIFVGYGGDDESVAAFLKGCSTIPQVYWLNDSEPHGSQLEEWWETLPSKRFVAEYDFDKIMGAIKSKFNLKTPDFDRLKEKLEVGYQSALHEEEKSLEEIEEKNYMDYVMLGDNLSVQKDYDKAIIAYRAALTIYPCDHSTWFNLGYIYGKKEFHKKAIEAYTRAIEFYSEAEEYYTNLFESQLIENQYFDEDLEVRYVSIFSGKLESFIYYELLKILQRITHKEPVDIKEWEEKYQFTSPVNWDFDELDSWVNKMDVGEVKEKLEVTLEVFKNHQPLI